MRGPEIVSPPRPKPNNLSAFTVTRAVAPVSARTVDAIAREHLAEVERKIADLQALRRELADVIAQCGRGTIADCRIIDALSPE